MTNLHMALFNSVHSVLRGQCSVRNMFIETEYVHQNWYLWKTTVASFPFLMRKGIAKVSSPISVKHIHFLQTTRAKY